MLPHVSEYLTTEQVCGQLAAGGVDEATVGRVFSARMHPQNLDDPKQKFVLGVPADDDRVYLVVYRFGPGTPLVRKSPLDENGPDWRPRWLSVEGPFSVSTEQDAAGRKKLTTASKAFLDKKCKELIASG